MFSSGRLALSLPISFDLTLEPIALMYFNDSRLATGANDLTLVLEMSSSSSVVHYTNTLIFLTLLFAMSSTRNWCMFSRGLRSVMRVFSIESTSSEVTVAKA